MTTRDQNLDPEVAAELDEPRAFKRSADVEMLTLRATAAREQVRAAGFSPDRPAGRRLLEIADHADSLPTVAALKAKASELGLVTEPESGNPVPPSDQAGLIDPNFPSYHPRNDPNDVASKVARRDRALGASVMQMRTDREAAAAEERRKIEAANAQGLLPDRAAYDQAIAAARTAGDWTRASALQLEYERKVKIAVDGESPPTWADSQPADGLTPEARALLTDNSRSHEDRIAEARAQGLWSVASQLQRAQERAAT